MPSLVEMGQFAIVGWEAEKRSAGTRGGTRKAKVIIGHSISVY
jgi:hypothetical protein